MSPLLIAFIIGVAPIVVGRLVTPHEYSTWAALGTVLFAVLIIVGLGLYYRRYPPQDLRLAGDDLYYLGLLFTLVSLIMALVLLFVLQPDEGDLRQRTNDLIGNFGIALVSTVAGILGRILLQSIEDKPTSPTVKDEEPLPSIPDSMMELRQQLRQAISAFSHFTRVTQSQAEQVKVHSERLIREFNDRMSAAAERGLSEVMTAWRKSIQAVASESDRLVKHLDEETSAATARTETAWRGLAQEVAAVTESARRRLATDADEMATLLEKLASSNRGLSALAASLEAAERSTRLLGKTAASAAIGLDDRAAEFVAAHDALARGVKNYQEESLQAYKDAVSKFAEGASERLEREGDKWLKSVEAVTKSAKARLEQGTDDAEAVRRLGEMISHEAERSLVVVERMRRALAEVVPQGRGVPKKKRMGKWLVEAWGRWRR